jgi:hypothetical protein
MCTDMPLATRAYTAIINTFRGQSEPLSCPNCRGEYLHHEVVTVYDRREDADFVTRTEVRKSSVSREAVNSENSGNPSSRRDGLAIQFSCEMCSAMPELTLQQHKGQTFLAWRHIGG